MYIHIYVYRYTAVLLKVSGTEFSSNNKGHMLSYLEQVRTNLSSCVLYDEYEWGSIRVKEIFTLILTLIPWHCWPDVAIYGKVVKQIPKVRCVILFCNLPLRLGLMIELNDSKLFSGQCGSRVSN